MRAYESRQECIKVLGQTITEFELSATLVWPGPLKTEPAGLVAIQVICRYRLPEVSESFSSTNVVLNCFCKI